jgi:hypothetical protein
MLSIMALILSAGVNTAVAKLPPGLGKEMTLAVMTLNKALALESWPAKDACVDRGGLEALAKDVSAADTTKCAQSALAEANLPNLGKSYALAIIMADIGPATIFAVGMGDAAGWGAYSCDPTRKCNPTSLNGPSKPAKRLAGRYQRACADAKTIWFPARTCPE